jgi:hypothetical protein
MDQNYHLWIGQLSERVTRLERRVRGIAERVDLIWHWGRRALLLACVWIGAVWTNATAEDKAAMILSFLKAIGG